MDDKRLTYVNTDLLEELFTRIRALEFRVTELSQEVNKLDWEINGEDFDEEE